MQIIHTEIARKFTLADIGEFRRLYSAGRLSHISYCESSGRIYQLADGSAIEWAFQDERNVYADVLLI